MASRATIKTLIRTYLGTSSDDPAFSDAILDPIVQDAVDSLLSEILRQNRAYLSKKVTLVADSSTSHDYTFSTQATPITDFAFWLEVRYVDSSGALLDEARLENLREAGTDFFAVTGPDDTPVLVTSEDSPDGKDLFFRYAYWPAELADDNSVPSDIPKRFHGVIPLEALFAFELGGEGRLPRGLSDRWVDRKAQLLAHVGRRGTAPSRTRIVEDWDS